MTDLVHASTRAATPGGAAVCSCRRERRLRATEVLFLRLGLLVAAAVVLFIAAHLVGVLVSAALVLGGVNASFREFGRTWKGDRA